MLEQTQRAIGAMKASGFDRHDFKARVERHYIGRHPETGRKLYEYGDAIVYLLCPSAKFVSDGRVRMMLNTGDLDVTELRYDGHLKYVRVRSGTGQRKVVDLNSRGD